MTRRQADGFIRVLFGPFASKEHARVVHKPRTHPGRPRRCETKDDMHHFPPRRGSPRSGRNAVARARAPGIGSSIQEKVPLGATGNGRSMGLRTSVFSAPEDDAAPVAPLRGLGGIADSRLPGTHVPGYIPPSLRDCGASSNRNTQPLISHHTACPGGSAASALLLEGEG